MTQFKSTVRIGFIKRFFFKISLRNQKLRALFEVEKDLEYLKKHRGEMLNYDESKARKKMVELKKIENRSEVQEAELDAVLSVIADSKAVKNEWEKSIQLGKALEDYIKTLN